MMVTSMRAAKSLRGKIRKTCNENSNPSSAHTRRKCVFYRSLTYDNNLASSCLKACLLACHRLCNGLPRYQSQQSRALMLTHCTYVDIERRDKGRILNTYLALNVSTCFRFLSRFDIQHACEISHTRSLTQIDRIISGKENFG